MIAALNYKNTTTSILMDETNSSTIKNLTSEHEVSQESSTSSNRLLKPENNNLWNANLNDLESMRNQSPSLSNIAGEYIQENSF